MEILIAIFIVACLAVIYYWIFDAKQKEKQELIKEQINGLIESHTNQLKSEGVNVDTVYTYQDNAFKQLDWSKAVAFRLIVDVANRQIVICNDLYRVKYRKHFNQFTMSLLLYVILCYEIFFPLIFPILRFMKSNGKM